MVTKRKKKKPSRSPVVDSWVSALSPEARTRVYTFTGGSEGLSPLRFYGGHGDGPIVAEVMLETGWCVRGVFTDDSDDNAHSLSVFNEDGHDVEVADMDRQLRGSVVRCYCRECLTPRHLDDENTARLRAVLGLRRNVAEVNGIPTDGEPDSEQAIDSILNRKEEDHADV